MVNDQNVHPPFIYTYVIITRVQRVLYKYNVFLYTE